MRLAVNVEQLGTSNGITVQVFQVSQELARRGHAVDVLYVDSGEFQADYEAVCRSVTHVPGFDFSPAHPLRGLRRMAPSVYRGVRTNPDLLYVNRFAPLTWAAITSRLARAPVVCHVHGYTWTGSARYDRLVLKVPRRYIAVSDFTARGLMKIGVPDNRVTVIHNGIDPDQYPQGGLAERSAARAELGLPDDAYVVLFYGRIEPGKGPQVLAEAAGAVGSKIDDLHLLLVGQPEGGPAYLDELRRLAGPVPVHWLAPRIDVLPALHSADVIAAPSTRGDPFPRVVIEGLATGRPVVGADIGGIPEALGEDFPEMLFPPGDAEALGARLAELASWRQRDPGLGARCRKLVERRFTLARMVDAIEAEFQRALS